MKAIVWYFFLFLISLGMIITSCICVAANGITPFFFYDWIVFHCVCVFFISSSVDEHLGCLHALAVEKSAAIHSSRGAWIFFELFFLGLCPGEGLLDHVIILILVFWATSLLFLLVAAPISIPISSVRGFPFLYTMSRICYL